MYLLIRFIHLLSFWFYYPNSTPSVTYVNTFKLLNLIIQYSIKQPYCIINRQNTLRSITLSILSLENIVRQVLSLSVLNIVPFITTIVSSLTLKRLGYLSSSYFMYVLSFKAFQEQDANLLFITSFVLTVYKVLCTKNDRSRIVTVVILSLRLVSHLLRFGRHYLKMGNLKYEFFKSILSSWNNYSAF